FSHFVSWNTLKQGIIVPQKMRSNSSHGRLENCSVMRQLADSIQVLDVQKFLLKANLTLVPPKTQG
ncbi:hypothetical protein KZ291_32090, partial [Escherichia coli]|uniref:hypothetical protein n=1 Tax=Escherichia coli TaxID=562 RepID=UPI001EDC48F8